MQLHPSGYWEGVENIVTRSFVFWDKIQKILRKTTNREKKKILRKVGKTFVKTVTDALQKGNYNMWQLCFFS